MSDLGVPTGVQKYIYDNATPVAAVEKYHVLTKNLVPKYKKPNENEKFKSMCELYMLVKYVIYTIIHLTVSLNQLNVGLILLRKI